MPRPALLCTLALLGLAAPRAAQSNTVPGLDVALGGLTFFESEAHTGSFPNGNNAFAMATTSCNVGTVNIPWLQAMNSNHPFISFLVVREENGRMWQISDRSWVKHAFFALSSSQCTPCQNPSPGTFLGVGCSDTYSTSNNGDNFWLGPPDEIDPWLGLWDPNCSYFDQGDPPVSPPNDCDGSRSFFGGGLGPIGHRVKIGDRDLLHQPGSASFYYASHYVARGEAAALRDDNFGWKPFTPAFQAGQNEWDMSANIGAGPTWGSVLDAWAGATVASASNGSEDGRLYVGVNVIGPVEGLYRYEYAIHNRDNHRGVGAFRIPICPSAQVQDALTLDPDDNAGNGWTMVRNGSELVFSTGDNPVVWNTIHNFSFLSDAAPIASTLTMDAFAPGPGVSSLPVALVAPGAVYNVYIGDGCSDTEPPRLYSNDRATVGNATFELGSAGNDPGAVALLLYGLINGTTDVGNGCFAHAGGAIGAHILLFDAVVADPSGVATFPVPVPNMPAFEGLQVNFQSASVRAAGGPLLGLGDLTNGLRVRVGDALLDCP